MRTALYGAAALALATLLSPQTLREALATAASALFEATPFAVAGLLLMKVLRSQRAIAYLGCGCATGPSARSLPAAAATWLLFGLWVAAARFVAALLVERTLRRRLACEADPPLLLAALAAILPAAMLSAGAATLFEGLDPARLTPPAALLAGAALGFAAPCGLGAIAFATVLRTGAPLSAAAYLCIAGIVDLRAFRQGCAHGRSQHDACAYLLLATALSVVAWRRGDALVNPALAPLLACCALAALHCAAAHRTARAVSLRLAPCLMLAGAIAGAPPPEYRATETTLENLFAGERLTFTGRLARENGRVALVRYAIFCCRADAAPIVVRLDRTLPYPDGTWLRADGAIRRDGAGYALGVRGLERVAPPADPFVYR